MAFNAKRPRINLRQGLDRDVYQIIKKMEDANDGKPFKSISAAYEAIKRSNSSLSRQKKRPLEDSIERVLQFRKDELGESSDSEAGLEEEPKRPEDERFLLNRQMTKHWNTASAAATQAQESTESRATKKRRLHEDAEGVSGNEATTPKSVQVNGNVDTDVQRTEKDKTEKSLKKSQRASRYKVETPTEAPQLGGVDEVYKQLRKQMGHFLKRPGVYMKGNWLRNTGILLSGPSGIGKKSLVRALAASLEVPIVSLTGCFEDVERMERSLNDAIDEAMRLAPCIIFIDQLDWWMSNPGGSSHGEQHRRVVRQFAEQMKRIAQTQPMDRHVLAMATTSRITDVDPAVLKTGLFEWTIQMRIPDLGARKDILELITRDIVLSDDVDFAELGKITHGFVGADIVNVVKIAQRVAIERLPETEEWREMEVDTVSDHLPDGLAIEAPSLPLTLEDFRVAIKNFTPSLRKEGFTVIPNVTWAQVGALKDVREQLDMSIIGPIKDPELYRSAGLSRPAGCLLWGPPGCGKTLVAQAVANEAQASFILINGPELLNKYVGESERAVRELFNRARSSTPCILFFDEMDSLVPSRDSSSTDSGARVVNALLTELDGAQDRSGVYVIGTTNRPDMIDPAMLRPGRLSVRLFVDLPTPDERVDILRAIYRTNHPSATEPEFAYLEVVAKDERCKDYSGADLGGLHVKAAESALKRCRKGEKPEPKIDSDDWENALSSTSRSVLNPESYRRLDKKLGAAR
ncbi:Fc.00g030430.m01.CDS01 [Cosmosporella sp. VM-42]